MKKMIEIKFEHVALTVTTLCACIAFLYRVVAAGSAFKTQKLSDYETRERKRLEECERMHAKSQQDLLLMQKKLSHLEGRQEGVENLSHAVLKKLTEK